MRQLAKGPEPRILATNANQWTEAYVEARKNGAEKQHEHWRHRDIKAQLHAETDGKCAYCEAVIGDVSFPHVEHMIPKSIHPELAHTWSNLTSACQVCNINKGDYYHPDLPVLNPYIDDIGEHIDFPGGFANVKLTAARGEATVKELDLNRIDLAMARIRRLAQMNELLERWKVAAGPKRDILAKGIRLDAAKGEYTATVFQHLRYVGFPLSDE